MDGETLTAPELRARWESVADRLLEGLVPCRSPEGAGFTLPGPRPSDNGRAVDAFEGFSRSFLLAAFRIPLAERSRADELAERYGAGLAAGTGRGREAWPAIDGLTQPLVEAAAIATGLLVTREQLWDRLDRRVQDSVIAYLVAVRGLPDPNGNWLWFLVMIETFLGVVTGESDTAATDRRLEKLIALFRSDGFSSDGDGEGRRHFDYYSAWALNFYPALWARFDGDRAPDVAMAFARQAEAHVPVLLRMIGGDGMPIAQGRSLTYRAAVAAGLWAPAVFPPRYRGAVDTRIAPAATRVLDAFLEGGALQGGVLTLGWRAPYLPIVQHYSGPASPYWMSKAFVGLLIHPSEPAWSAPDAALPVDLGDFVRPLASPGWLLQGTSADGIVRLHNHGTDRAPDHRDPHSRRFVDDPLYARSAYSTATAPVIDEATWAAPTSAAIPDNGLVLCSGGSIAALRSGVANVQVSERAAVSTWTLSALDGARTRVTSAVVVRGEEEVRLVRFTLLDSGSARLTGYAVADDSGPVRRDVEGTRATTSTDHLRCTVVGLTPGGTASCDEAPPNAFGRWSAVPSVSWDLGAGEHVLALTVTLAGGSAPAPEGLPVVAVIGSHATVSWPTGLLDRVPLPAPGSPPEAG